MLSSFQLILLLNFIKSAPSHFLVAPANVVSPVSLCLDLLQQGAGGPADQDQRDAVGRQTRLGAPSGGGKSPQKIQHVGGRAWRWDTDGALLSLIGPLQLKKVRSLMLAGATDYEGFPQQLRLLEAPFKLSAKDLRSQVVREACITLG